VPVRVKKSVNTKFRAAVLIQSDRIRSSMIFEFRGASAGTPRALDPNGAFAKTPTASLEPVLDQAACS
jgi:hypothetical protein